MDEKQLQAIVKALGGPNALSYALKEGGLLVIVDCTGRKQSFSPEAYQHLLKAPNKSAKNIKGAKDEQSE